MPRDDNERIASDRNNSRASPPGASTAFPCDRCGAQMVARQCKVTCPNCGNRFDCSDLNLYFDELRPGFPPQRELLPGRHPG